MSGSASSQVTIRGRRQVTLPAEVCDELGLAIGDQLEVKVEDGLIVARPKKLAASEALNQIRRIFAEYGPSLDELLQEAEKIREDIFKERYAKNA